MHNPEALEQLSTLGDDSTDWVNTIHAIRAFYSQDFGRMEQLLSEVPGNCPAGKLKKVLFLMAGIEQEETSLNYHEERLVKRVTEDSRFLKSAIEQLRESLEYGEDLFIETVSLLIKEIKKSPEAAERLVLWSFKICEERGFSDEALSDNVIMLFGQAEGLRLIGLSLIETEPDSSLICFIRSFIRKLVDKTTNENEAAAYLKIIAALISACPPDAPVLVDISEMLSMLESELVLYFGLDEPQRSTSPADRVSILLKMLVGMDSDAAAAAGDVPEQAKTARPAVQLELF